MRAARWRIDQLLTRYDCVTEDHRVRFMVLGASSLDIEIAAYLIAPDYGASLAIRGQLILAVIEIFAECGRAFAFSSTAIYLARDQKPGPVEAGITRRPFDRQQATTI